MYVLVNPNCMSYGETKDIDSYSFSAYLDYFEIKALYVYISKTVK